MVEKSQSKLFSTLEFLFQKTSSFGVGITIICYLCGFIITNMYLGSLGVVNFELLRTRYVLTGALFLSFWGLIIFLIWGLNKTNQNNQNKPIKTILFEAIYYSIFNLGCIYFILQAISIVSGSYTSASLGIPGTSKSISWLNWFKFESLNSLKYSTMVFSILIVSIMFMYTIVETINQKGKFEKKSLKVIFVDILKNIKDTKSIGILVLIFLFSYFLFLSNNLLKFIATQSNMQLSSTSLSDGWIIFYIVVMSIYIPIAFLITIPYISLKESKRENKNDNHWLLAKTLLITVAISLILHIYVFTIFPEIPQQIGGGKLIPVLLTVDSIQLDSKLNLDTNRIYLVDRTSDSILILIEQKNGSGKRLMEVASSNIESITYEPLP